jgi:predicted dehydrogenase/threonine dehydrogenase-like Zn-dependent dehydrogenase
MEQLTQNLKSGEMKILEVPYPMLSKGCVLVRNHYSIISAGTEGKTVKDARLGYIGKAMARKDEVKKVINTAKTIGLVDTYKLMMNKLDAPSALGYSCAGEVIAVADDITEFKIGDKVACAGAGAVHAEVVAVPKNLCVKLADDVLLNEAAFTTLGAIALQGIRQADLQLGESCAVIGLGILGQLTIQMLNAAGVQSIGIDIDKNMVSLAQELGASHAIDRNTEGIENSIRELTKGYGVDAVIITAATSSTDPVDFAGELCRHKGKVIIVGSVPTGFKRAAYYRKELELKMSCSYGPGRYDRDYEEAGVDYPYGYVRWTENRNMQAFADLLHHKKLNIAKLISHVFDFKEASKAYQMIVDKTETFTGILLKYDTERKISATVQIKNTQAVAGKTSIGFIGAGSFANNVLLPALKDDSNLVGIATSKPNNARNIADKYGFDYCTGNVNELMTDKNINTIFIATRHDSHANYVMQALQNNKNVFTEKPLCLNETELEEIKNLYQKSNSVLMLGFNRRFSPHIIKAKAYFDKLNTPLSINYRINAGTIAADHWVHDKNVGGGRIVGEVCHFIDLLTFITNSKIKSLSANAMQDATHLSDTLTISLQFENGSIGNISYFSNGNKNLDKEYLEIFGAGQVIAIHDFKEMEIYGSSKKTDSLSKQDKGHKQEVTAFLNAIATGKECPISFEEIYHSMLCTFKIEESIALGGKQILVNS